MSCKIDRTETIRAFFTRSHRAHLEALTAKDYEVQLNHFDRYFADYLAASGETPRAPTLADLSTRHIYAAMDWQLARRRSRPTADKVRRALLAIWNKASELSEGELHFPGRVRGLKKPAYEPTAWTIEEFGRLLWGAGQLTGYAGPFRLAAWFPALLRTVYNSGLRISATMAIRREWVNITSRRLVIDPSVQKDDEGRTVGLLPETLEALAPLLANGKAGPFDDWPFDRHVVQWPALTLQLRRSIIAAGLAENAAQITRRDLWHKLRRTFATQIYIATKSIEEVKRRLGHSSIEVSYRYIDFAQTETASEIDLLPRPNASPLRVAN